MMSKRCHQHEVDMANEYTDTATLRIPSRDPRPAHVLRRILEAIAMGNFAETITAAEARGKDAQVAEIVHSTAVESEACDALLTRRANHINAAVEREAGPPLKDA